MARREPDRRPRRAGRSSIRITGLVLLSALVGALAALGVSGVLGQERSGGSDAGAKRTEADGKRPTPPHDATRATGPPDATAAAIANAENQISADLAEGKTHDYTRRGGRASRATGLRH